MLHQTPYFPIPILLPSRRARGVLLIVVNTMLTVAGYLVSPCPVYKLPKSVSTEVWQTAVRSRLYADRHCLFTAMVGAFLTKNDHIVSGKAKRCQCGRYGNTISKPDACTIAFPNHIRIPFRNITIGMEVAS